MSLKRNFKVRVRDYKLAPPIEDAAPLCGRRTSTAQQRIPRHFALQLRTSTTQWARLRYATKDTALFCKRSCSEIRLWVSACGVGIWAGVIRARLRGTDFAPPSAPPKKFYRAELW